MDDFISFPYRLHKNNRAFVPPLLSEVTSFFDLKRNPFFKHAEIEMYLARIRGKVVGRIAAILDHNYLKSSHQLTGQFGFFESVDDLEVAHALFNSASQWHRKNKLRNIMGPTNPSMNHDFGVLMSGFDEPPAIGTAWNPYYYPALYENSVFEKAKDFHAYTISKENIPERVQKLGDLIVKRSKISFRHLNMNKFMSDMEIMRGIYNKAAIDSWGFVPWNSEDMKQEARLRKKIIDPDLVLIAEDNGSPVGFSLALPDRNFALQKIRRGRLALTGWLKLWWLSRKISSTRIMRLEVIKEYQHREIDTALYYETFRRGTEKGYNKTEISLVLEDNVPLNSTLQRLGSSRNKTYRLFERSL